MAKRNKEQIAKTEEQIQAVEESLTKTEAFLEKNGKVISFIVVGIALIILGYFAYQKYYVIPKENEAASQLFMAERYFEQDSLQLALNGNGQYPGFLDIIKNYGSTKSGNLANYYAGASYLKLGEYEKALDYLDSFDGKNTIVNAWNYGLKGDTYMELGKTEKAADYYMKAVRSLDNNFTQPYFLLKAGMTYELLSKPEKALENYERIQNDFPNSVQGRDIAKYIARVKK